MKLLTAIVVRGAMFGSLLLGACAYGGNARRAVRHVPADGVGPVLSKTLPCSCILGPQEEVRMEVVNDALIVSYKTRTVAWRTVVALRELTPSPPGASPLHGVFLEELRPTDAAVLVGSEGILVSACSNSCRGVSLLSLDRGSGVVAWVRFVGPDRFETVENRESCDRGLEAMGINARGAYNTYSITGLGTGYLVAGFEGNRAYAALVDASGEVREGELVKQERD